MKREGDDKGAGEKGWDRRRNVWNFKYKIKKMLPEKDRVE